MCAKKFAKGTPIAIHLVSHLVVFHLPFKALGFYFEALRNVSRINCLSNIARCYVLFRKIAISENEQSSQYARQSVDPPTEILSFLCTLTECHEPLPFFSKFQYPSISFFAAIYPDPIYSSREGFLRLEFDSNMLVENSYHNIRTSTFSTVCWQTSAWCSASVLVHVRPDEDAERKNTPSRSISDPVMEVVRW